MTAVSTFKGSSSASALFPGKLIDSLIESVVLPHNPLARAVVICDLLREMCAAVEWLQGTETTPYDAVGQEVASLRQLVAAAQDHQRRMETFGTDGAATAANNELV